MVGRLISRLVRWRQEKTRNPRVFLSYAHEDEQAVAVLASDLQANDVNVWFAPKDLLLGDQLTRSIQKAIRQADYFLLVATPQSQNSRWVSKEISYALRHEPGGLTIIPLRLTGWALPELLADHKAVDMRSFVYKAGLSELLDRLHERLPVGRTPLGEFEDFVNSLPVFDDETQEAVDSYLLEKWAQVHSPSLFTHKRHQDTLEKKFDACEQHLTEHKYDAYNMLRVFETLRLGRIPPALQASELRQIRDWLRVGHRETLAIAASLYESRFVRWPSHRRILKSNIEHYITAWISRGEISQEEAPTPEWLINALVDEQLIRPFRRDEYVSEPTEDYQEFHWGSRLTSVGKAAYLYEREHPDRPHDDYPIDRLPGSTPS